jgi:hypothetical protein
LRHAVLSDARPLCAQEQTSLPTKKVRALALDAIEKRVAARAADLAPTIKQLQAADNTTLRALAAGLNAMASRQHAVATGTRRRCAGCSLDLRCGLVRR